MIIIVALAALAVFGKMAIFKPGPNERGLVSDSVYPSQILNLNNWKLTLPIASDGSKTALDILRPELDSYQNSPLFAATGDKKGVVFRAPVNGVTTGGSDYPRTELREMTDNGTEEIFWPSMEGTHTLVLEEAITAVPKNKPVVVAGQIHGDDDDLLVIRLEYPKLYITRGGSNLYTLDENYTLGKKFTVKFSAGGGKISVYYNNSASPVYTLDKKVNEAYFKAGAYVQSNCDTEEAANLCNADNYGEVVIYRLDLTHQTLAANTSANIFSPLDRAAERITKKPFGIFITPATSPIQPEKFRGFHTGVDFEIFPDELEIDIPVKAVCSGNLALKKNASGYGGVAVQECELKEESVTIIYGHLKLESITAALNQPIKAGEVIGILGANNSAETNGERKHLHLAIHRGKAVELRGYVESAQELSGWTDPCLRKLCES